MSHTCLIYGCTGQDGSYLSKTLLKKGYNVIGISRSNNPNKKKLCEIGIGNELRILTSDLNNLNTIQKTIEKVNPNYIYNLGAQSSVGLSFKKPYETYKSISDSTSKLLEACRLIDFKGNIFFAGSSEIYGNTKLPAQINSKPEIMSPYADAKYQSYLQVKLYREIYGLNAVTGVLFNHESPIRDDTFVTQKIISGAIECSKNKFSKLSLGNINISRDWGWASEYVEAMQLITRSETLRDQIICTGNLTKLKDFIKITFNKLGMNWRDYVDIDKTLFRGSEILNNFGNPLQMEQDLGWKSEFKIEDIIENIINYEMNTR